MVGALERALARRVLAYPAILLLQTKVVWGIWRYRDLGLGDTAGYYSYGLSWARHLRTSFAWSPLYTAFLGSVAAFREEPYAATTLHRIVILLVLAAGVLAVFRRLLPPGLAWLAAAWWVVLPNVFDARSEVHLFAVLPVVAALLALGRWPGRAGRGVALALLAASGVLIRNEQLLLAALFAACAAGSEVRSWRAGETGARGLLRAYGAPLVAALALVGFVWIRRVDEPFEQVAARKVHGNFSQVYAFGYGQRHPEWKGDPWTDFAPLLIRQFGLPMPSLGEALRRNPRAVAEQAAWNLRLVPNGLQALLFGAMSGRELPGYEFERTTRRVLAPTAVAAALLLAAAVLARRGGLDDRVRERLRGRAWEWALLAGVAVTSVAVVVTQRPRPAYLLPLGLALRAAIAAAAWIVARRLGADRLVERAAPAAALALLVLVPPHWTSPEGGRPLLDALRRVEAAPHRPRPEQACLAASAWGMELAGYLDEWGAWRYLGLASLADAATPEVPLEQVLADAGVTRIYADERGLAAPAVASLVAEAASRGWRRSAGASGGAGSWAVLDREPGAGIPGGAVPREGRGLRIVDAETPVDPARGPRGLRGEVLLEVDLPGSGPARVHVAVAERPEQLGQAFFVTVTESSVPLAVVGVRSRGVVSVELPRRRCTVVLRSEAAGAAVAGVPSPVFRVVRVWS